MNDGYDFLYDSFINDTGFAKVGTIGALRVVSLNAITLHIHCYKHVHVYPSYSKIDTPSSPILSFFQVLQYTKKK